MSRYRRVMLSRGRPALWLPDCASGHGRSEGGRQLCLLIHEEEDKETFKSLIEAWDVLLASDDGDSAWAASNSRANKSSANSCMEAFRTVSWTTRTQRKGLVLAVRP